MNSEANDYDYDQRPAYRSEYYCHVSVHCPSPPVLSVRPNRCAIVPSDFACTLQKKSPLQILQLLFITSLRNIL